MLERAYSSPFTTKSDFMREHTNVVAMAASDGYITTRQAAGLYGNEWRITVRGLKHLNAIKGVPDGRG